MTGLIFHLIPHTHWDREWYLPRAAFQARLVAVLDDLIERLQRDPAYRTFLLDGQTVLLEDYLRARPERDSDIKALVKTGRLQVGPWYVLPDEQIPSGEGLVRNLLLGATDAERWGGRLDVLYSPDAFGHPAAWPTLAREFGIRYGVVWRGLGGEVGQERDLYRWAGLDGKEVLLWHLPPAGYEVGAKLSTDAERVFATWAPVRGALVARAAGKHIPVFIGADHHAAHPEVSRLRDLLAELDPQSAFRVSRLDEFFQAAAEGAKPTPLAGELRWSYRYAWTLQGVHATRAPLKRRYSEAELMLTRLAEPLAALARRAGGRDRRPLLELAWRGLVRCQFHDSIAGCVSDAVAHALETRLGGVEALASEIVRGSVHDLAHHDPDAARARPADAQPTLVLWNPAARPRRGVAIADVTLFRRDVLVGPPGSPGPPGRVPRVGEGYGPLMLATADGRAIPVQVLDRRIANERLDAQRHYPDQDEVDQVRIAVRAPPLAGLGLATVAIATGASAPGARPSGEGVHVKGRSLVNHWIEVALEPTGALALHDRRSGQRFAELLRIEDGGDAGDTYSYCPPAAPPRGGPSARDAPRGRPADTLHPGDRESDGMAPAARAPSHGPRGHARRGRDGLRHGRATGGRHAGRGVPARDARAHGAGAPIRGGGERAAGARAPRSRVLRIRVDARRRSAAHAAAVGGRVVARQSADASGTRRLADRDAARPVSGAQPHRPGIGAGVAGRAGARRRDPRAVGGRLPAVARVLAA
ncbi:MAG: hypothetical protein DMD73_02125 [Gemmatimonadetes bacterium]|nr:MAG: hypothetical protein DMD73_02125 [Gemmatimonadota bacterium]